MRSAFEIGVRQRDQHCEHCNGPECPAAFWQDITAGGGSLWQMVQTFRRNADQGFLASGRVDPLGMEV